MTNDRSTQSVTAHFSALLLTKSNPLEDVSLMPFDHALFMFHLQGREIVQLLRVFYCASSYRLLRFDSFITLKDLFCRKTLFKFWPRPFPSRKFLFTFSSLNFHILDCNNCCCYQIETQTPAIYDRFTSLLIKKSFQALQMQFYLWVIISTNQTAVSVISFPLEKLNWIQLY